MPKLPTKPPTAESTMPTHPKPKPIKTAPPYKAPAKEPPAVVTYRTGGHTWASRLLEHMMSPVYRNEEDEA